MPYKISKISDYDDRKGWVCGQFFDEGSIEHSEDVEVKHFTLKPGDSCGEHFHPRSSKEIVIVLEGEMEWLISGKKHLLKSGDILYLEGKVPEAVLDVRKPTRAIAVRTPSVPDNKVEVTK